MRVIRGQHIVLNFIVATLVFFCGAVTSIGKFDMCFVIGDSYVDNGNRDRNNDTRTVIGKVKQSFLPPFGRTNPGYPNGRFSDGKVLSDCIADYIGLDPRPYREYSTAPATTNVSQGINFAVGGAGVKDNLGFIKSPDQIKQLLQVLSSGVYNANVYNKSLILYAISGNDYNAVLRNSNNNELEVLLTVPSIVAQMVADLQTLYTQGFRNFVVVKLAPVGCLPFQTFRLQYSACTEANLLATEHNSLLVQRVQSLFSQKRDANLIFLDNFSAFNDALSNVTNPDRLKPCCTGQQNDGLLCGDVYSNGSKSYSLCNVSSQSKYFFWDEFHPTEAGWNVICNFFKQGLYTDGVSLKTFLGL